MLEALKQSAPIQGDRLKEEDEALIKSIFQGSREFVRRIDDDELDDDVELAVSGLGGGETSQVSSKKRKAAEEVSDRPTDYLTKSSTIDRSNKREDQRSSGNFVLKSSTIKFSVMRKPSEAKTQAKTNEKEQSRVLQSLCLQYDSDEEDE